MNPELTIKTLKKAAKAFCDIESTYENRDLYGVTDGKAVGTYIEHKFQKYLEDHYTYEKGSSAKGIDLPGANIQTDIKVTSVRQPQSSCPFKDAKQKIFGLGYNLLIFVYNKTENSNKNTSNLHFISCSFLEKDRTADYTTTFRIREMIQDGAIKEDIIGYLNDKSIPADEITLSLIADQIINNTPKQGYLTISNALQWRLQYARVVNLSETVDGIIKIVDKVTQ